MMIIIVLYLKFSLLFLIFVSSISTSSLLSSCLLVPALHSPRASTTEGLFNEKSMCFCESTLTINEGILTTCLPTLICFCLISTLAWWMDLAIPDLNTRVCKRCSESSQQWVATHYRACSGSHLVTHTCSSSSEVLHPQNTKLVLLIQGQKHSSIVTNSTQSILYSPQLSLTPQPILSHQLQLCI